MSEDQSSLRQFGADIEAEPLEALRRARDDDDDTDGHDYLGRDSRFLSEWVADDE